MEFKVGEIITFDTALSAEDLKKVHGYLDEKYAITSVTAHSITVDNVPQKDPEPLRESEVIAELRELHRKLNGVA